METYPFRGPLVIKKKTSIEQIIHKNNKHVSIPKDFNKFFDTSISGPTKATLVRHKPKLNPFRFVDPYEHINPTDSTNNETDLVYEHEEHTREDYE